MTRISCLRACLVLVVCGGVSLAGQGPADVTSSAGRDADGLNLAVYAAAYRGNGALESVLIGTEIRRLAPPRPDRSAARSVELVYSPAEGSAPFSEQRLRVPLDDEMTERLAATDGVRVLRRLALPAGRFRIRVTVRDSQDGRTGSVVHDVEVPPYVAQLDAISISGVMVTSSAVSGFTHADRDEEYRLQPILLQPPAARRRFARSEKVEVLAEVYERELEFDLGSQMTVVTRVVDAAGETVFDSSDIGASENFSDGRYGYQHWQLVPVRDFTPGDYLLQVGAVSSDGQTSAWRSIPITVVPDPSGHTGPP